MSSRKLRSSMDAVLSELIQKKAELEKLRLHLVAELERVDNSLTQIQAEYVKTISPLLNLPTEVTCMIFNLAVASHSVEDYDSKKKLPEVVISHVCKKWRDASLSYPRLWTKFFFRAKNVKSMRNSINRFDLYIKRSKSYNLDLFIDFRKDYHYSVQGAVRVEAEQYEMIDMAIRVVERWKTMTFYSDLRQRVGEYFGLKSITASAPNLEYFEYSPESTMFLGEAMQNNSIDSLNPILFQGGAPKLHYLSLDSPTFRMPPFSNITTLRLEVDDENIMADTGYPWITFLEILSIPSLANLSIVRTIFWVPKDHDGISTIPMNNLKHLRYSNDDYMTLLLPFLRAPLLETLIIRNDEGLNEGFETNPFGLTEEDYIFPSLHTLTLIDTLVTSYDLAWRFMNLTKNITSLLISHDNPYDNFFAAIQQQGPFDNQCWPNLTTITARIDTWEDIDDISDFGRSRPKKSLKMRLFRETYRSWKANFPEQFARIKRNCNLERLGSREEAETTLVRPMWPPEVDCPDYAFCKDPFEIPFRRLLARRKM